MKNKADSDTRYFIDIELKSLKIVGVACDQKQNLDRGMQKDANTHRLFLTRGQYNKFVKRCKRELSNVC